jgi:hypothetical protein
VIRITSEAGNRIFKHAKERLYLIQHGKNEKNAWKKIAGNPFFNSFSKLFV